MGFLSIVQPWELGSQRTLMAPLLPLIQTAWPDFWNYPQMVLGMEGIYYLQDTLNAQAIQVPVYVGQL